MDDDDLGVPVHVIERTAHGVLPARTALHDDTGFDRAPQVVRRIGGQRRRQRDDDVGDRGGADECVETALEDRAAGKRGELFRVIGPEAQAAPTRGDDG